MAVAGAAHAEDKPWLLHDAMGAPERLKLSGSVRGRYETVDNQVRVGLPTSEDIYSVRTILTAEYASGPVRFIGELHDSRVFGARPGSAVTTAEVNTLEPVQAYAAVDFADPFGVKGKASVQAGRFMLNIASRRFVAADDYRNTTNGYTGFKADLATKSGIVATAFAVAPIMRLPDAPADVLDNVTRFDRESSDALLWGGVVSHKGPWPNALMEIGYYGFRERDAVGRPTRDRELSTFTSRLIRNPAVGKLDFEAEGAVQTGTVSVSTAATAAGLDVKAGFVHLDAGYQFPDAWKSHLVVEYDWMSGDDDDAKFGRFDTLFGMRRGDFGPSGIYNVTGRANMSSPGVRYEVAPNARLDGFVTYHPMWLASSTDSFSTTGVRDATGHSGDFAGHQVEGRVRYWLMPGQVRLEADYALVAKGHFLRDAPNAPGGHGATQYLSLNTTVSF
jgi:hypothetical protein